ncbi:MAG: hypothetical protein DMG06_10015 [Acidobacteria bacterium]|nr:MAG: hypothetical protein DMG06_10015 [Acidobacteriota bacterium]
MFQIQRSRWVAYAGLFMMGLVFGITVSGRGSTQRSPIIRTLLENEKVLVREIVYERDSRRSMHVRPNDQLIVFLDDAKYEVVSPDGKKESRTRKAGEVIWHSRGETAPNLTNTGDITYRTIVVNFK